MTLPSDQGGPGAAPVAGAPAPRGAAVPPARRRQPLVIVLVVVGVLLTGAAAAGLWVLLSGIGTRSTSQVARSDVDKPLVTVPGHQPLPLSEQPRDFVAALADATSRGDVEWLLSRLHPAVLTRYGEDACRRYVTDYVVQPGVRLRLQSTTGPGTWVWETDGRSSEIDEVYNLDVHRFAKGVETTGGIEAANVDGTFRFFADCGSPRR